MPTNLTDGDGFLWDVQDNGSILNGSNDAFDGGFVLTVNGVAFPTTTQSVATLSNGSEVTMTATIGNFTVVRRVFVPNNDDYVRFFDQFTNNGVATEQLSIQYDSNLGSNAATDVIASSTGDGFLSASDVWVHTDDSSNGSGGTDPNVLQFFGDVDTASQTSPGLFAYTKSESVDPGETVSFLQFGAQQSTAGAMTSVINQLENFGGELTADLVAGGDAVGQTLATASTITPTANGTSIVGAVDASLANTVINYTSTQRSELTDQDYYAANLTAGVTYNFELRGAPSNAGTLSDPYLRILDGAGLEVAVNDDYLPPLRESLLQFTPTASGVFYISAGSFSNRLGTYTLSAQTIGVVPANTIVGSNYAEALSITPGFAAIRGLGGNDTLNGDSAPDTLEGGDGADELRGRGGADTLNGDAGNDTLFGDGGGDVIDGGANNDDLRGRSGNDRLLGGDGADTLNGDGGNDRLEGGAGNDSLRGRSNNDNIFGEDGNDTLGGDSGNDTLDGGAGADELGGGAQKDEMRGRADDDSIDGGDGNDSLFGDGGNDVLRGGFNEDDLRGRTGNDNLQGEGGFDLLNGDAGNDTLGGGGGSDTLRGRSGDDFLNGGAGADTLGGDGGNDRFIFTRGGDADTILDFTAGAGTVDTIDVSAFGAAFNTIGEIRAATTDVGGDAVIDFGGGDTLTLIGVQASQLSFDDFIFT